MHRFATIWAVVVVALIISPQAMQARNLLGMEEKMPEGSSSLSVVPMPSAPISSSKVMAEKLFGRYRTQPQLIGRSLVSSNPSPDIGH